MPTVPRLSKAAAMTDVRRLTGPGAGPQKYDLLTALAVSGLAGSATRMMTMMRLIALITARYNWHLDELTVGQREMARLWSVDERTVKREVKRLTEAGLLVQLRPGVRGKVAAYRLNQPAVAQLSAPDWPAVGPDFVARMGAAPPMAEKVIRVDFQAKSGTAPWDRTLARLAAAEPGLFQSWFNRLGFGAASQDTLILTAPNSFIAQYVQTHLVGQLLRTAAADFPTIRRVVVTV